jgi:hypothetical protein
MSLKKPNFTCAKVPDTVSMNPHPSKTATSGAASVRYDVKEIKILQRWARSPLGWWGYQPDLGNG